MHFQSVSRSGSSTLEALVLYLSVLSCYVLCCCLHKLWVIKTRNAGSVTRPSTFIHSTFLPLFSMNTLNPIQQIKQMLQNRLADMSTFHQHDKLLHHIQLVLSAANSLSLGIFAHKKKTNTRLLWVSMTWFIFRQFAHSATWWRTEWHQRQKSIPQILSFYSLILLQCHYFCWS